MATILTSVDFTDSDAKSSVKQTGTDWSVNGDNVYLYKGDQYYYKLLRDYSISQTDPDLASPPPFQIKEILKCYVETLIYRDLIDDARAPYENQTVLVDKFRDKLKYALACLNNWLKELDENAFYDEEKGTDSNIIGTFGRR